MATEGMMPERVFIDPATLTPMTAAPATSDAEMQEGELEDDSLEDKSKGLGNDSSTDIGAESSDSNGGEDLNAPSEESQIEKAETADAQSTDTQTVEDNAELAPAENKTLAGGTGPLDNPWKGISLEQLERLRPLLLWRPIPDKLISLNPVEGFMIWLKAGLVAGVVIGSPGIFWHVWQFFAAGLYPHERRYVYWYLPLSLVLFLGGVSLAFFVVFRMVLGFLMQYSTGLDVEFTPRLNDYMSFALFLPLGFGIAFQLPIVMLGLHRFGLVSVTTFVAQWRIAVPSDRLPFHDAEPARYLQHAGAILTAGRSLFLWYCAVQIHAARCWHWRPGCGSRELVSHLKRATFAE